MLKLRQEITLAFIDDFVMNVILIALGAYLVQGAVARHQVREDVRKEAAQAAINGLEEIAACLSHLDSDGDEIIVFADTAFRRAMSGGPYSKDDLAKRLQAFFFPEVQKLNDRYQKDARTLKEVCDRHHFWITDEMYDELLKYPERRHLVNLAAVRGDFAGFVRLRGELEGHCPTVDTLLRSLE